MKFTIKDDIWEYKLLVGETYEYLFNHDMASFILNDEGRIVTALHPDKFKELLRDGVFELGEEHK